MLVVPERLVAGGDVLARDESGRIVFVSGALPGDEVEVEITEAKKGFAKGVITQFSTRSVDRVEPPCARRREGCGGCDWQHLVVPRQLAAKVEIVKDALRRTGGLTEAVVVAGGAVAATAYRTTIRVVGDEHGRAAYRRADSNDTIPASGCLTAHPALESLLDSLRLTPQLEVMLRTSVATGAVTARWDSQRGEVDGLPSTVYSGRRAFLTERIDGRELRVSAASFFQSGPAAAGFLVDAVRRAAPELETAATVLDAYAGVGLFAATVTASDSHVITVESSTAAVEDCRVNLDDRLSANRADIVKSEFSRWRPAAGQSIDVAIADPARPGLSKPGVKALVRANPDVIVLVSCDPVAGARDAKLLIEAGYRHQSSEVLDLFPHTHHVETVTRFEK